MKILKELVKDIERDLVISLEMSIRHKGLEFDESKRIAKEFINYYPFESYEDLFDRLYFLSTKYRVVRKVYVKYSPRYYQEKSDYILSKMRRSLLVNDVEDAVVVARKANYARA